METPITLDKMTAPPLPLHRFSVEEYRRLGELGVLTSEDRVELLEGWIVEKMNQRPIHGFIVRLLNETFQRELPDGWLCQCQLPIATARSEPEPDIAILRGEHADFRNEHPRGEDCELIIEVADTSLDKDRAKAAVYAAAGVREYWIVNVTGKCVERYDFRHSTSVASERIDPANSPDSSLSITIGSKLIELDLRACFD